MVWFAKHVLWVATTRIVRRILGRRIWSLALLILWWKDVSWALGYAMRGLKPFLGVYFKEIKRRLQKTLWWTHLVHNGGKNAFRSSWKIGTWLYNIKMAEMTENALKIANGLSLGNQRQVRNFIFASVQAPIDPPCEWPKILWERAGPMVFSAPSGELWELVSVQ